MFITKKHISRRTVLRGAGAALALPFLESMIPAGTAQSSQPRLPRPQRFVGLFTPHGMAPGIGFPARKGRTLSTRSVGSRWSLIAIRSPS